METILGIKGPDFVMLAADCTQAHSIITLKEGKYALDDIPNHHPHNLAIDDLTKKKSKLHSASLIHIFVCLFVMMCRSGQNPHNFG